MTLLEKLNKVPPFFCRMVARTGNGKGCRSLTLEEISHASGLDVSTVSKLSKRKKWAGESIEVASSFSQACGIDLLHPRRHLDYMRRRKRTHMNRNPQYWAGVISAVK